MLPYADGFDAYRVFYAGGNWGTSGPHVGLGESANYVWLDPVKDVAAVPEPASWALSVFGVFGYGAYTRLRKRTRKKTSAAT